MTHVREPQFIDLDDADVRSILARNNVGRLAFMLAGEVDIRPLHYVYFDGAIYGRTSPQASFARLEKPMAVAFEVDEVESVFQWRSVIAKGRFEVVSSTGPERDEWKRAAAVLRRVIKQTFVEDDPLPDRNLIFRIRPDQVTGRRCV